MIYIFSFVLPFSLSLIITPLCIYFAHLLRIIDFPSEPRKLHMKPTALLGGFSIFISFFITLFLLLRFGYILDSKISPLAIISVVVGSCIIMIGGYLDDTYNLEPTHQIIYPIISAIIAIMGGIHIAFITNPSGGVIHINILISFVITFLWLLGMMYTTKFLDGLDGLVSGISVIASVIIFVVSLFWDIDRSGTSFMSLALAGACLGFLIFNFYPAKIFLGEGGSIFVGYILGILSIISGSKIATAVLIMGFPIIDSFWVIVRRIRQGKSPARGDRRHFHFSLLDSGLTERKAVFVIYAFASIFGLSSLFLGTKGKIFAIIILIITSSLMIKKFYIKSKSHD